MKTIVSVSVRNHITHSKYQYNSVTNQYSPTHRLSLTGGFTTLDDLLSGIDVGCEPACSVLLEGEATEVAGNCTLF